MDEGVGDAEFMDAVVIAAPGESDLGRRFRLDLLRVG